MDAGARDHLLMAALKVYATSGSRGATTRRIAREAGVNEVTLFRQFGSKDALLREAISSTNEQVAIARLPEDPVDPEAELTAWGRLHFQFLFGIRSFIRTGMAEFAEHPELTRAALQLPLKIANELHRYVTRLRADGLADGDWNARAATALFMGVLFADAMQRDAMPARYPYTQEEAVRQYVALFLRAIGVRASRVSHNAVKANGGRAARHRVHRSRESRHA